MAEPANKARTEYRAVLRRGLHLTSMGFSTLARARTAAANFRAEYDPYHDVHTRIEQREVTDWRPVDGEE